MIHPTYRSSGLSSLLGLVLGASGCGNNGSVSDAEALDSGVQDALGTDALKTPAAGTCQIKASSIAESCGGTDVCPVEFAANVVCPNPIWQASMVPIGSTSALIDLVIGRFGQPYDQHGHLVKLESPPGSNREVAPPFAAGLSLIVADSHGAPHFFGYSLEFAGVKHARYSENGPTEPDIVSSRAGFSAAAAAPDGSMRVQLWEEGSLTVMGSTESGTWSQRNSVSSATQYSSLAVDGDGRDFSLFVVSGTKSWSLNYEAADVARVQLVDLGNVLDYVKTAVVFPEPKIAAPAVTINMNDGLHLLWPTSKGGSAVHENMLIPGTSALVRCDPGAPRSGLYGCGATCTERGANPMFLSAQGMVRTHDGTTWLAFLRQDVDRDITMRQVAHGEVAPSCDAYVSADRSGDPELNIARVTGKGADVRFRVPLPRPEVGQALQYAFSRFLVIQAWGDHLHVAVALPLASTSFEGSSAVRYFSIDTGKL